MEKSLRQRVLPLPAATRQLLLVAAAEPTGDAELLWRAARQLGIKPEAAAPAVRTGLVEFDGMVRFCHPLARTVVYQAGSPGECRRVHRALAYATDSGIDPDRRAWHRARCAADYDEEVAADLERTAERARARGGLPALAAFRARAAELTADPADRSRRALAAAEVNFEAGAPIAARRLLAMAQAGSLDELATAHAQLLRAQLAAHAGHGSETSLLLVEAAQHLQRIESRPARETYAVAFDAALTVGCLSGGDGAKQIALTVRAVPPTPGPSDGPDVLLEGLAVLISEGHDACAPLVKRALRMLRDEQADAGEGIRWLPLACRLAQQLWDDKSWHALTTRLIDHALHEGALTVLPGALLSGSVIRLLAEGCEAAVSLVQTAEAVGLATGNPVAPYARLALAAWRGAGTETSRLIVDATTGMIDCGQAGWPFAGHWATAVLNNGLARYNEALIAAKRGSEDPEELGFATWCLVELIEAAVRTGSPEEAAAAFARLSVSADASATTWALGIKARSLALMNEGGTAERLYLEAIDSLGRTLVRADLGRAHLLYGEWLRRQGRRVDARLQLRTAHDILIDLGIGGFAERARRELAATGATVRKGTTARDDLLTAQETQIAAMARAGHTNPQIGVELFISGRTVEWHLRKVFMKLGISSRRELSKALPA
jgi:DNA-binding CsgD family transcriptional regulator